MYDFASWFLEAQEPRCALSGWFWLRFLQIHSPGVGPQASVPHHGLASIGCLSFFVTRRLTSPKVVIQERLREREAETERQREYEQRSKRVPKAETVSLYNPMSKATYHCYAGCCWAHRPSLVVGGDDAGCGNQKAGIVGGHVGGCQPQ